MTKCLAILRSLAASSHGNDSPIVYSGPLNFEPEPLSTCCQAPAQSDTSVSRGHAASPISPPASIPSLMTADGPKSQLSKGPLPRSPTGPASSKSEAYCPGICTFPNKESLTRILGIASRRSAPLAHSGWARLLNGEAAASEKHLYRR